ncbi:hypothetical protein [Longimicrobium sp.]|uniref:hypothetical protein n=1 Tax=Longimicrobium sp. TaxID=2029185 RepID=UPI003B3BD53A
MPKPILRRLLPVFLPAACLVLAACPGRGGGGERGAVKMDTANTQWEDGMSAQQVETEAKALSPEEAARMGIIVDTTIHLEQLDSRDTASGGGAAPTPAPATSGATAPDSVPSATAAPPAGAQPQKAP